MSMRSTAEDFFDAVNARDLVGVGNLLSSESRLLFPKTKPVMGRERILRFLGILYRRFPELVFHIERIICQDQHAAVHWTNNGIDRRQEPYQNEGVTLIEADRHGIVCISDFFKDTEVF